MDAKTQILAAAILGTEAYNAGKKRVAGWDPELMAMMARRKIGETPPGEAPSVKLMEIWLEAWDAANLAEPI